MCDQRGWRVADAETGVTRAVGPFDVFRHADPESADLREHRCWAEQIGGDRKTLSFDIGLIAPMRAPMSA